MPNCSLMLPIAFLSCDTLNKCSISILCDILSLFFYNVPKMCNTISSFVLSFCLVNNKIFELVKGIKYQSLVDFYKLSLFELSLVILSTNCITFHFMNKTNNGLQLRYF